MCRGRSLANQFPWCFSSECVYAFATNCTHILTDVSHLHDNATSVILSVADLLRAEKEYRDGRI